MFKVGDYVRIKEKIYNDDFYLSGWLKKSKNSINFIWVISSGPLKFEKEKWYIVKDDNEMTFSVKEDWLKLVKETNIEDWT